MNGHVRRAALIVVNKRADRVAPLIVMIVRPRAVTVRIVLHVLKHARLKREQKKSPRVRCDRIAMKSRKKSGVRMMCKRRQRRVQRPKRLVAALIRKKHALKMLSARMSAPDAFKRAVVKA